MSFRIMSQSRLCRSGLCRSGLFCNRDDVIFGIGSFWIVSFELMSLRLMSFGIMMSGILSVYQTSIEICFCVILVVLPNFAFLEAQQ